MLTACATQLGSASGQSPTPCDPASPPVFRLVAPSTLPVGFRSGAYLERAGRPDPDGPFRDSLMPVRARFAAEGDGRLEHRYSGGPFNSRDLYDRWPLRFARGDGPARFSVTYGESSRRGPSCRRTLETIIHPRRFRDPGIRLDRPRVRQRIIQIGGVDVRRVSVTVTGTTRRSASRPVRIDGYLGKTIIFLKQARVRDRRLRATAVVKLNAGQASGESLPARSIRATSARRGHATMCSPPAPTTTAISAGAAPDDRAGVGGLIDGAGVRPTDVRGPGVHTRASRVRGQPQRRVCAGRAARFGDLRQRGDDV